MFRYKTLRLGFAESAGDSEYSQNPRRLKTFAAAWYREDSLIISDKMTNARQDSLDANDFIADFLSEYTETREDGQIRRQDLIAKLRAQCSDARRFNDRELTDMVAKRGIEYVKTMYGRVFKGVRLINDMAQPDFE